MRGRSGRANDAWEALLTAHGVLMKNFLAEDIWAAAGVSMREYDVLYSLSKQDGPLRLGELNRWVLLSQPALSRMVDRLVARGLVQRSPDPSDGRGILLQLSEEGRARQREIGLRHAQSVARAMLGGASPEELEQLEAILHRLARSADRGGDGPAGDGGLSEPR